LVTDFLCNSTFNLSIIVIHFLMKISVENTKLNFIDNERPVVD